MASVLRQVGGVLRHDDVLEDLASLALRPLDFVFYAYPWGEVGTELEFRAGPVGWQYGCLSHMQSELLKAEKTEQEILAEAMQIAIRSGHDVGKSAFLCWIIQWGISTRVDTRGRVTANTEKQLTRTLWPELSKWHQLFIGKDFFRHTATAYISADPEKTQSWRVDAIPWSEDNPEAFAGLHNLGKRILILFDEASGIHDKIWETIDGVAIEAATEIVWIATGNPTRANGRFRECFERQKELWHTFKVDSRDMPFTNKERIEKAIALYGLDSDYVKVRYLGEFPDAGSAQLFPTETIERAASREVQAFHYEPLIISVDVARFGKNESVIAFRRGKDMRSLPALRFRGLSVIELGDKIAGLIVQHSPDAVFIDEGGVGGGVVDYVRSLGHSVIGVNFGSKPGTRPGGVLVANKRAEMYVALLVAMREGLCIENDSDLIDQLTAIEYFFTKKQEIILVSKEDMESDGVPSPDWADALAISYAYPVSHRRLGRRAGRLTYEYDPYGPDALNPEQDWSREAA